MRLCKSEYINMLSFDLDVEIQAVEMLVDKLPNAYADVDGDLRRIFVFFD